MSLRIFPTCALAVLLLTLMSTIPHHVDAAGASGFAITAGSIEKVTSDKQLDTNQLFAKTWQIKGNAAKNISFVDAIRLNVPGRVFITYAESSASGAIGDVKVSGSSESVVSVVEVVSNTTAGGPKLVLQTTGVATEGAYLLTEIQLYTKNKLKDVLTKGSADVVVLDNVLYTKGDVNATKSTFSRRLSDKSGLVVEEPPWEFNERILRSHKTYFIKPASGSTSDVHDINLSLGGDGWSTLAQMDPDDGDGSYAGKITVADDTNLYYTPIAGAMDRLKLVSIHGADGNTLKLASTATTPAAISFRVDVTILPSIKMNATYDASIRVYNHLDTPYDDRLAFTANGTGDVFIVDQNSTLHAYYVSFESTGSGTMQVDVADIVTVDKVELNAWGSGNVTYLGHNLSSSAAADLNGEDKICLVAATHPVAKAAKSKMDQVAYTGKIPRRFVCITLRVPQRVPSNIGPNEKATAVAPSKEAAGSNECKSSSSSPSSAICGLCSTLVAVLVTTAAVLFTAFD